MRSVFLRALFFLSVFSPALMVSRLDAAVIQSAATGNWNTGASWVGGVSPGAADTAVINTGHTITNTAAVTIRGMTIRNGGTVISNSAITINAGLFTINPGGTYNHSNASVASSTIFNGTESFANTSNFIVTIWSATGTPLINGLTSNFGNLTLNWAHGNTLWNNSGLGVTRTINGNFVVGNTCVTYLNQAAGNIVINIGGNFTVQGAGYLEVKRNSSGNVTFNVAGNTLIQDANSVFYGIIGNNATASGALTYTTVNYTQTNGTFRGTTYANVFGSAGGSVTFTASGAWTQSGGQHIGVNFPANGNWGIYTYSVNSFTLTAGSVLLHQSDVTDGRTCTFTCTNDFNMTTAAGTDFFEFNGIVGFTTNNAIYSMTVGGNMTISGSTLGLFNTKWDATNPSGADNITVVGNLTMSGCENSFSGGSPQGGNMPTCAMTLQVGGHVSITGTAIVNYQSNNATSTLNLNVGTASVNWAQTTSGAVTLANVNILGGKTVTLTGTKMGNVLAGRTINVNTGGRLNCDVYLVEGAGAFTLSTGARLGIGNIAGITSAGATGNIRVTGTRTYTSDATYEYYLNQTPQITGNFTTTTTSVTYPVQVTNLIINKTNPTDVVTLTNTTDMINNGTLTLTSGILTTSATAATAPWIRIPNNATSVSPVGGSANSYVDGYIRKTGNGAFIFPTGDAGFWRRIEVTAPSISTEFEARYIRAPYTNITTMSGAPSPVLDHVSQFEHWMLSKPLGADGATTKVKLYWENASQSGILKFDSLTVARWSGTGWENTNCYGSCPANWTSSTPERTYSGSATGTGAGTIQSNTVSSFSPFTFGSTGDYDLNPLPVELVSFTAVLQAGITQVDWITQSETNNDYFTIERTRDGMSYEGIGTVDGAGNSNEVLHYHFIDLAPYEGISYYRLKQTDFDGKTSYSALVAVNNIPGELNSVTVAPNPANTAIALNFMSELEGTAIISIYDAAGQLVYTSDHDTRSGSNSLLINISSFSKGFYLATVLLPGEQQELKKVRILKQE